MLRVLFYVTKQMGWRYACFRFFYELKKRTGILKLQYPTEPPKLNYTSHSDWKKSTTNFFFKNKADLSVPKMVNQDLRNRVHGMKDGVFPFFNGESHDLSTEYDWLTNPKSGHRYDTKLHWTKISTFNRSQGDIKYVWEKSRFCYLYDIIRYDYHFDQDLSGWVFSDIVDWINSNPINRGPHYTCSQEISIRCFNWLFAMCYYRDSAYLDKQTFELMIQSIYWQIKHVRSNMSFSLIAVRNNHTLTEALALYVFGTIFPELRGAGQWRKDGKRWFIQEIDYQIYEDGTFLQYSMNYHRVIVQLLTWALTLSKKNGDDFGGVVRVKANKSLEFLLDNMDVSSGHLPNYGANDGALFFKLNDSEFRDYRPQLNALSYCLNDRVLFTDPGSMEELAWYGFNYDQDSIKPFKPILGISSYGEGGYFLIKQERSFTFIRCGSHPNRPSQADNLHVDIWHLGKNILRDSGSYGYNTDDRWRNYFNGSISHNTVLVNQLDQMERGPHFIWLNWTQATEAQIFEQADKFVFEGKIKAFAHSGINVHHYRKLTKFKSTAHWIVEDSIECTEEVKLTQVWNPIPSFLDTYTIASGGIDQRSIPLEVRDGWYSNTYGSKEKCKQFHFNCHGNYIHTEIKMKEED